MEYKFKYFQDPLKYARYVEEPCEICGSTNLCLNGDYLERNDELESVCLDCLVEGKVVVQFPSFLYDRLSAEVKRFNPKLGEDDIRSVVKGIFSILEKTPPVPWIQYNDWPVCCGDFMLFLRELEREDFNNFAGNGNGKEILLNMLDDETKNRIESLEILWDELGDYSIAYQFECFRCNKTKVVIQSF